MVVKSEYRVRGLRIKKEKKWLNLKGISFEARDIKVQNLSADKFKEEGKCRSDCLKIK